MFDRNPRTQNSNQSISLVNNLTPQTSYETANQINNPNSETHPSGSRPGRQSSFPRDPNGWCENHQIYGHTTQMCKYPNGFKRRPNRGHSQNPSSDRTAEHRPSISDQEYRNPPHNPRDNLYNSYPRGNSGRGRGGLTYRGRGRGRGSGELNQPPNYANGNGAPPHNYYQGARGSGSYGRGRQRPNVYTMDEADDPTSHLPLYQEENQGTNDNLDPYQQQTPPHNLNQNLHPQYEGQGNLENPAPHGLGIINAQHDE